MTLESQSRIVCNWMEIEPELPPYWGAWPTHPWWVLITVDGGGMAWAARNLDLDCLRLIEQRIITEAHGLFSFDAPRVLLGRYVEALSEVVGNAHLWHATAEQKIAALASVLPGRAE